MNWKTLIGSEITVDGEQMKVTDCCITCRQIWAETTHHEFFIAVNKQGTFRVKAKRIKALE